MDSNSVRSVMNRICKMKPAVYRVSVWRNDHNTQFRVSGDLRGEHSGKSYSASGKTPRDALLELERVLKSLTCPTCGHINV